MHLWKNCTVQVLQGSILKTPTKNILVSIGEDRVMKWATAKALTSFFWNELQELLLKDVPFEKWDTRVVPFQGWNCIFGRPFDYKIPQLTILGVEAVIRKALEICDTNGWKEIAISALAGNYLGENDDQINDITRVALEYYFERNPESGLERIYLVNFEREIFRI